MSDPGTRLLLSYPFSPWKYYTVKLFCFPYRLEIILVFRVVLRAKYAFILVFSWKRRENSADNETVQLNIVQV